MKITSSEPKDYLGRSGKRFITSLGLKTIGSSKKINPGYAITNVGLKDISKILKKFEKLPFEVCVWKRPKHEPADSYFYLAIHLAKYMMRPDTLNLHVDPVKK